MHFTSHPKYSTCFEITQLSDGEFGLVLSAVYGSADAPGRVIAQGAAGDRVELQAVPSGPLVNFICDSYEAWLNGASHGTISTAELRLKPELTILRGKVRRSLSHLSGGNIDGSPNDMMSMLQGADFSRAGRLDWPSFVRVLTEDLHLIVSAEPSSHINVGSGLSLEERAIVARQVERSDAHQREAARLGVQLMSSERDEASINLARDEELKLLCAYREGHKSEVVRRRLQDAVTASAAIYPRFGQVNNYPSLLRFVFKHISPM